jgi:hypothetical protein
VRAKKVATTPLIVKNLEKSARGGSRTPDAIEKAQVVHSMILQKPHKP